MATKLLSIKDGQTTIPVDRQWVAANSNSLQVFVDDLRLLYGETVDGSSIPDIWANARFFQSQLIKNNDKIVTQWRSMLAILALRKYYHMNLTLEVTNIPAVGSQEWEDANAFMKMVSKLLDAGFASFDGGDKLQVIKYDNNPIAFIWPEGLICPVARNLKKVAVDWHQHGEILDPCQALNEGVKKILVRWLIQAKAVVNSTKNSQRNAIIKCLNNYIKDLGFSVDITSSDEIFANLTKVSSDRGFVLQGFAAGLATYFTLPITNTDLKNSHIRISALNGSKSILLVDEQIQKQWQTDSNTIFAVGSYTLKNLLDTVDPKTNRISNPERVIPNLNALGAQLWTAENIFTDRIAFVVPGKAKSVFPTSMGNDEDSNNKLTLSFNIGNGVIRQQFILPIRQEVLDFVSSRNLYENISISREEVTDEVAVSLTLKLSGLNGSGANVTISKTYTIDKVVDFNEYPNVQIWPNFKSPEGTANPWKQYYVFQAIPNPENDRKEHSLNLEPCWNGRRNQFFKVQGPNGNNDNDIYISRGTVFPEAFIAYEKRLTGLDNPVGLVLLDTDKLKTAANPINTFYLGVDFGTTNSVVYYSDNIAAPEAGHILKFQERLFNVTAVNDKNKEQTLRRYFFPTSVQPEEIPGVATTSIRTIFHDFNIYDYIDANGVKIDPEEVNKEEPLIRGNIYYPSRSGGQDNVIIDALRDKIKWDQPGAERENEERMKSFIYQLGIQALAEAVMLGAKQITWNYSWPTAYKGSKEGELKDLWTDSFINIVNSFANLSDSSRVCSNTESLAMSEYFKQVMKAKNQAAVMGILCMDIGGGSTDISIWKGFIPGTTDPKLIHQCSFKFAGVDIFTSYLKNKLKKNTELLEPLKFPLPPSVDGTLSPQDQNKKDSNDRIDNLKKIGEYALKIEKEGKDAGKDWRRFELELESFLKLSEKLIEARLPAADTSRGQHLNELTRDIAFSIGGIFFYCGTIIAHLSKNAEFGLDNRAPQCYIGGNASKLLNWMAKGEYSSNPVIQSLLFNLMVQGMVLAEKVQPGQLDLNISIKQSDAPKHEVAHGLVATLNQPVMVQVPNNPVQPGNGGFIPIGNIIPIPNPDIQVQEAPAEEEYPVVSGEFFAHRSKGPYINGMLTRQHFSNPDINIFPEPNGIMLHNYIYVFNYLVKALNLYKGLQISFDEDTFNKIHTEIIGSLTIRRERGISNPGSVELEPIFIMELKEAVNSMR